ncbi:MAG: cytochrome c [Bauldia sp.]|nr:cytochrome c [Bauldia sp.]
MVQERQKARKSALRWAGVLAGAGMVAGLIAFGTMSAKAQDSAPEYDQTAIDLGFRVWKEKVTCGQCHGWSGNGTPDDPRAPIGLSLRTTQLTPEQVYEVIKCGRPATQMPAFDQRAYEDDRCYGVTAAELGNATPPKRGVYLIPREINALVAYIFTHQVGRSNDFTDEDCRAYFGQTATICDNLLLGGAVPAPEVNPHQ